MLHKLQDINAVIYIKVDIKIWICVGIIVVGDDNVLSILTSKVWHQRKTLTVWTQSILSSLSSCGPALCQLRTRSNHWVQQLHPRCCGGDRSNSLWFYVVMPVWVPSCPVPFSCDLTSTRSSLKPSWISMTLIPTLFLPALNPKYLLSSPVLMIVFLQEAIHVLATRLKKSHRV